MLSTKSQAQLTEFLNTLEQETGIKADFLQVYTHNGTEETAKKLENQGFEMEAGSENTWMTMEDTVNECRFRATYFYESEEAEPEKCDRCERELTPEELCSPFLDETCTQCYNEMKAESRYEKSEYMRNAL